MAAEKVTPEAINFMARFGRGLICLSLTEERCDYLRLAPDDQRQRVALRHRLHRIHRSPRGRHHRHQRRRPRPHHPGRRRSRLAPLRPGAPRPHLSPARPQRRRARPRRANRSQRRSGPHGRTQPLRRHLRNHERRRHHGARARTHRLLPPAQPQDDHHRRDHPLPHGQRAPGRAPGRSHRPHPLRRIPHDRLPLGTRRPLPRRPGARRHWLADVVQ